ncbi:MAG: hypothetical protein KF889_06020, partial [Alphaproteobacteria bacterium]|nr:hypothetical protein [Alphaproteobacteria bacterium]
MSERLVIARSRRQRARRAATPAIARASVPAIYRARGALLSGTAFAALVACGLFAFNDRALAQGTSQLPTGGTVVGGSATITQPSANQLTVT